MGKGSPDVPTSPYEEALALIAKNTYENSSRLRGGLTGTFEDFFGYGNIPTTQLGGTPSSDIGKTGGGTPTGSYDPLTGSSPSGIPGLTGIKAASWSTPSYGIGLPGSWDTVDTDTLGGSKTGGGGGIDPNDPRNTRFFKDLLGERLELDPATEQQFAPYAPLNAPSFASTFSTTKQGIEDQYGLAKENILSSLPRGGAMQGGLINAELSRAEQMGALPGQIAQQRELMQFDLQNKERDRELGREYWQAGVTERERDRQMNLDLLQQERERGIYQDILNKAYGVAFGAPGEALAGYGSAAGSYGDKQSYALAAQAKENAAKSAAAGGLAVEAYPYLKGLCYVAEVLFGNYHTKTGLARFYCATHNNQFVSIYRKYGKKWAESIKDRFIVKVIIKPIWWFMAYRGRKTLNSLIEGVT